MREAIEANNGAARVPTCATTKLDRVRVVMVPIANCGGGDDDVPIRLRRLCKLARRSCGFRVAELSTAVQDDATEDE